MHDNDAEGNEFFKCDFCRSAWSEDRQMVEGHKGSLICGPCLSVAFAEVVINGGGTGPRDGVGCALCLQTNQIEHWLSPLDDSIVACRECIERGARTMEKDPDTDWTPPSSTR